MSSGQLYLIGLGPGSRDLMSPMAVDVLSRCDVVIGYSGYTGMTGPRKHLHFVVFEFLNADGRKSLPVTFRNVDAMQPLCAGQVYAALPTRAN